MDKELMGKEVLGILDTRQIQRFMFRSNSYVDTLGGSDLMVHILPDGILHALHSVNPPLQETEYDLCQDPDLLFEEEMLVKPEYASDGRLPGKLKIVNRYRYSESDTLTVEDYRLAVP